MTDAEPVGRRFGSLDHVLGLLTVSWGLLLAAAPLDDNSFLTHLATGRLILDTGSVPTADPYSFTAPGESWTVQSWLVSSALAGAEQAAGDAGLRLLVALVLGAAAALVWVLAAPARSVLARVAVASVALFAGTGLWHERPYMIGVIGLGLVWLALEGRLRPWLLAPLLWVWTNSHGSYPLAFVLIGAVLAGEVLDRRSAGRGAAVPHEVRVLGWTAAGALAGALGPLGVQVWLFPFTAFARSGQLDIIAEWQAPSFRTPAQQAFLVLACLGVLAVSRLGSWRRTLPTVVFVAAAVYASRNMVLATMVLVPVVAEAAPRLGTLRAGDRPRIGPAAAVTSAVLAVLVAAVVTTVPVEAEHRYPSAAVAWLESTGVVPGGRVVAPERVGNQFEVLYGTAQPVFFDDRVDMFPAAVVDDVVVLHRGEPGWSNVLDRYDADWVLWPRDRPLASLLAADAGWRTAFSEDGWLLACRRTAC